MLLSILIWIGLAWAVPLSPGAAIRSGVCSDTAIHNFVPQSGADLIALARCQIESGQPQQARESLHAVQEEGLKSYVRLIRAEALIAENRYSEAAELLNSPGLSGDAAQRARMLRGRALVEAGRYGEARAVLSGMLDGPLGSKAVLATPGGADPAEIRWWLAQSAVRRGAPERAVPVWRTLWARNPTSPRAAQAAQALARAGHVVPSGTTSSGQSLIRERIASLEKLHLYSKAWELRQFLPPDSTNSGLRAAAKGLFKAKDYEQAVVIYARIPSPTPQDRFDHALAMSRLGAYDKAARLYEELVLASPTHKLAVTASYKIGYLAYDEARLSAAISLLHTHLDQYPSSSHAPEARWFIAWSHFRLGDLSASQKALNILLGEHPRSEMAATARYWLARTHGLQGQKEAEKAGYEEVLRRWPLSGYAWWSAQRLERSYPVPNVAPKPARPAVLGTEGFQTGQSLARAGLKEWARIELRAYKPKVTGDRIASLYLAEALVEAGDYVGAQALARPWCASPAAKGGDRWAMQLCWPRPEAQMLAPEIAARGLPPHLPFAIMNAESALKPWVTSPAGARGLMQLMPTLADSLHAERFPGAPYNPDQLYQPVYNAMMGTTELGLLLARFGSDSRIVPGPGSHGRIPLTIAGYNGGIEAVERWLSAGKTGQDPDVFMENIGYTETRRYVRRVLGYMQTYRYIYGDR